jgi:cytochrome c biogenesis protein CcdA/thiol-disulfide isomerase/thioredoxin
MLSFTIATLVISYVIKFFGLNPNVLRIVAVVILVFLGLTMIVPPLTKLFEGAVSRLTTVFGHNSGKVSNGFWPGFLTGLSLGLIWSPCAGPILAAIATLAATGQVSFQVILVTLAYVTGVGIPLFIFAYAGQNFISRSRFINKYTHRIQQIFGVVIILAAILIYTGGAQTFQLALVDKFPALNTVFNGFESSHIVSKQLDSLRGTQSSGKYVSNSDLLNANVPAPEIVGINHWFNTDKPLNLADLKGKVVLVDFWTYTCINCIRTLPHVTSWYEKYKDKGFVVIGVHTPEFAFEKDTDNVANAITRFNIHYPVAQDNDYATWTNFQNRYWPAEYLIDGNGMIRRVHFGEGEYDGMERAIQELLKENGQTISGSTIEMPDQTPTRKTSPETYLGLKGLQYSQYYPSDITEAGIQTFQFNSKPLQNQFSFGGKWKIGDDEVSTISENAQLTYHFVAGKVYLVMAPPASSSAQVHVTLDGKQIGSTQAGKDVKNGVVTVDTDRLYELVNLGDKVQDHIIGLAFITPLTSAFAFTFGD